MKKPKYSLVEIYNRHKLRLKEEESKESVVDKIDDELESFSKQFISAFDNKVEDEIKTKQKGKELNEVGVMTTIGVVLATPAILGLISKAGKYAGKLFNKVAGKKPDEKNAFNTWMSDLNEVSKKLHHLYVKPLEYVVGKFVKDKDKAHKIANILFHVIVAIFAVDAGIGSVKAFSSGHISHGLLEAAMHAVKDGEIVSFVGNALKSGNAH